MKISPLCIVMVLTLFFFTACSTGSDTPTPSSATTPPDLTTPGGDNLPENPTETGGGTEIPPATTVPEPRTLTICLAAEPESLYFYSPSTRAQQNIFEAIYDGPIDHNNYGSQPVILSKLPYLPDGDAILQPVTVQEGAPIVDARGNATNLSRGVAVYPTGCQSPDCVITYEGGEIQMDQLSARFTLLEGVRWSDGQPLTAQDSVFSFQLDADPNTPTSKTRIERTASYTTLDERTVEWVGIPGFLDPHYADNFWHPLPQHVWGSTSAVDLQTAEFATRTPLGWGPFTLAEWLPGEQIRLTKNPAYFRTSEGLPIFDTLIFRFTSSGEPPLTRLLSGECDLLDLEASSTTPANELLTLTQNGQIRAYLTPSPVFEHADFGIVPAAYDDGYQLGVDRPDLFGDVRTRRAIAYCMDRQKIVDTVFTGQSEVPNTYLPSAHPLFDPNAPQYAYDPNAGITLLEEVGWLVFSSASPRKAQGVPNVPDGTPLSINYWTTDASQPQQAAQILADSLAQCGIQLIITARDTNELFASGPGSPLFGRTFDMAQLAWFTGVTPPCDLFLTEQIPGDNPETHPFLWGGTNLTGYSNAAFDTACQRALHSLPGQADYEEAHHLAQQIFAEDLPVIPLYLRLRATASRPDFCGYTPDPASESDFADLETFDYGAGCGGG